MRKRWQSRTLGDLCEIIGGGTPSKANSAFYSGNIPWATVRDMRTDVIKATEFKITAEAVKQSSTNIIPAGNVVIASRVGLGKVCVVNQATAINQDLRGIIPRHGAGLSVRFLYWYLKSIAHVIVAEGTGATVQGVKLPFIKSLQLPIPPLAEQDRIVQLLDDASAGIAAACEKAEKNLQNTRSLFESHLEVSFAKRDANWVNKRLGDLATNIATGPFGTMLHKSDYVVDGIPLVNPMNIVNSQIVPSKKMMVSPRTSMRLKAYLLKAGDVVIARRGELGRCALVTAREEGWLCGTGSFFLRLGGDMDPEFFVALFGSVKVKARLNANSVGTTMSNLNHGILKNLILPVPPIREQRQIMKKSLEVRSRTRCLENTYRAKLSALQALERSVLHYAFSGQA